MRMPPDFIEALNRAVKEVNPNAGEMTSGSFTLGEDFDEWFGPEAMRKYGFGPYPDDFIASFEAKFAGKREEIKRALVEASVEVEKRNMAKAPDLQHADQE